MNNPVSFAYDDVLGDNPFSDVVSPNAAGLSNSISTPHLTPSPPVEDLEPAHTSSIGATDTTTTTTSTDYAAITSDEKDNKSIEDGLDNSNDKGEVTTFRNDTNNAPATNDTEKITTTGSAPEPQSPSLQSQPPSPQSNGSSVAATTEDNDQLAKTTDSLTLEDDRSTSGDFGRTQSPQPLHDEDNQSGPSLRLSKSGAIPYFEVSVEDPQKVGDAINAHIVYKVKTKTDSPAFRTSEFVVARRYRDFLWLYNQLTNGNPGVIVPPVPEKHALGRFQDEFVESRRIALERCLRKTVSHPMLYGDPDLKVFLESESFNVEKRQKRAEPETPRLGFMRSFGETISSAATNPFAKFTENDDWFSSKKSELDALETQLKTLLKSVEGVVKQRKELGGALADFGESMFPLASAELNRNLSTHLTVLGDIQKQLKELHEEQAQYDVLTLEHTIDEYIRIIGSIRLSFNARIRTYQTYQQVESELQKKVAIHEKLKGQQKIKSERLTAAQLEIVEMQDKVEELERDYQDISRLIKNELDRFDQEKVMDFKKSVEAFLCSMIEHQKKVIALWETYFEQTEGLDDENDEMDDQVEVV